MRLTKEFYSQPADKLSALLLGKVICRNIDGNILKYKITETECYMGENDTACHAHKGKTKRNEIMFERGGFVYVYLCYGIHYMLNIVSGEKNRPEAVLIRKIISLDGASANGPGLVTKALKIDKTFNGEDLTSSERLCLEDHGFHQEIFTGKRIGIDYAAEKDRERLWRFYSK